VNLRQVIASNRGKELVQVTGVECEGSLCSSGAAWGSGGCGAAVSVAKGGGGVLGDFRGQVRVDAGSGRRAVAQPLLNQP